MLVGSVLLTVGSGVLTILNLRSSAAVWVVPELLAGAGTGLGTSLLLLAVRDVMEESDVSIGFGTVLTAGYLGSSIALAVTQTIFASRLKTAIQSKLPSVNPQSIVVSGATNFLGFVPQDVYGEALQLVNTAFIQSLYMAVVLAGISAFSVLGFKWKKLDMRDKK